jgi:hypothetical protein
LALVIAFISLLPKIFGAASASVAPPVEQAAVDPSGGTPDETVAVIAAAVAATLDRPHRIVKIRGVSHSEMGWSLEGRMQHHQSHNIQQRKH